MDKFKKIVFIVGPTAVGKTDVAVLLARKIHGEIVSCDSMQIYQEISIATNKPSREILAQVPHHLIDIVSVKDDFNVAQFNELAKESIFKIHERHHWPIVVGGSGMYIQILLDGIFQMPISDERLRDELKRSHATMGGDYLYRRLKDCDPLAAEKIHPHDTRRIIRALEVCLSSSQPISELQKNRTGLWGAYDVKIFGLNIDRGRLYEKINMRVDEMFESGVLEEVRRLGAIPLSRTAGSIIGIPEIQRYLRKECSREEAKEAMKQNTRRYAKRQMTYFRKEKRISWITLTGQIFLPDVVEDMIRMIHEN